MPKVGDAWYELSAKDAELLAALQRDERKIRDAGTTAERAFSGQASKGARDLGDAVEGTGKKAGVFGDTFRGMSTGVLMGVGQAAFMGMIGAVGGLGDAIIGGASSWNESLSKSNVVFGEFGKTVSDWAADAPEKLALTQGAALELTSTLGNLFVSLKLPTEQAATMSTTMVELAADLGSFNNVPTEEALEAIRSGLVGETEPLRRFGVNLNEATVQAKALELGLIRTTKDAVTPAMKAQAVYAIVLDQTSTAQGDFARTSTGFANASRIAQATLADGLARLGQKVLPALVAIMPVVIGGVTGFFDALDAAGKVLGDFIAFIQPAINFGRDFITFFLGPALPATQGLAGAMILLVGAQALGGLGGALPAIVGRAQEFVAKLVLMRTEADATSLSLGKLPLAMLGAFALVGPALNEIAPASRATRDEVVTMLAGMDTAMQESGRQALLYAERHVEGGRTVGGSWANVAKTTDGAGAAMTLSIAGVASSFKGAGAAMTLSLAGVPASMTKAKDEAVAIVRLAPIELARALAAGQTDWQAATQWYADTLKNDLTEAAEIAKLRAELASSNLVKGLHSKDAEVRAAAEGYKSTLEDRLFALQYNVPEIAEKTGQSYADALAAKQSAVRRAAAKLGHPLQPGEELPTPGQLREWGREAAQAYADGLVAKLAAERPRIGSELSEIRSMFAASSPPGPKSPLHEIDVWGYRTAEAWAKSFESGLTVNVPRISGALGGYAEPVAAGAAAAIAGSSTSNTVNLTLAIDSFNGSREDLDDLMDGIAERLRRLIPGVAYGASTTP